MAVASAARKLTQYELWAHSCSRKIAKGAVDTVLQSLQSDFDAPGLPPPAERLSQLILDAFTERRDSTLYLPKVQSSLNTPTGRLACFDLAVSFLESSPWLEDFDRGRLLAAKGVLQARNALTDLNDTDSPTFQAGLDAIQQGAVLLKKTRPTVFRHVSWLRGALLFQARRWDEAAECFRDALAGPPETATRGLAFGIAIRVLSRDMAAHRQQILNGLADDLTLWKELTPIGSFDEGDPIEPPEGAHFYFERAKYCWSQDSLGRMALAALLAHSCEGAEETANKAEAAWFAQFWKGHLEHLSPYAEGGLSTLHEEFIALITGWKDQFPPHHESEFAHKQAIEVVDRLLDTENPPRCAEAAALSRELLDDGSLGFMERAYVTRKLSHAVSHSESTQAGYGPILEWLGACHTGETEQETHLGRAHMYGQLAHLHCTAYELDLAADCARRALTHAARSLNRFAVVRALDLMYRIDGFRFGAKGLRGTYTSYVFSNDRIYGANSVGQAKIILGRRVAETDDDFDFEVGDHPLDIIQLGKDCDAALEDSWSDLRRLGERVLRHAVKGESLADAFGSDLPKLLKVLEPTGRRASARTALKTVPDFTGEAQAALVRFALDALAHRSKTARSSGEEIRARLLRGQLLRDCFERLDDQDTLWDLLRASQHLDGEADFLDAARRSSDSLPNCPKWEGLAQGDILLDFVFSRAVDQLGSSSLQGTFGIFLWSREGLLNKSAASLSRDDSAWLRRLPQQIGVTRESVNLLHAMASGRVSYGMWDEFQDSVSDGWRDLSNKLLPPEVADFLQSAERVFLAPNGQLSILPLHMLLLDGEPLATVKPTAYVSGYSAGTAPQKTGLMSVINSGLPSAAPLLNTLEGLGLDSLWEETGEVKASSLLEQIAEARHAVLFGHGLYRRADQADARFCFKGGSRLTVGIVKDSGLNLAGTSVLLLACGSGSVKKHKTLVQRSVMGSLLDQGADSVIGCMTGEVTASVAEKFASAYVSHIHGGTDVPEAYRLALGSVIQASPHMGDKLALGAPFVLGVNYRA